MKTLAATHAGDADGLERVARFDTNGQSVLNDYINVAPSRFPTPDDSGITDRDLARAVVDQIVAIGAPLIERAEQERESELVARTEEGLERGLLQAGCGRLSTDGARTCPLDGAWLPPVDAIEYVVEEAASQAAQVVMVRDRRERLRNHGGIAALLHW